MESRVMPASGADQHAILADEAVDEGGLAGVRAADDGDVEVALGVPALHALLALGLELAVVDVDVGFGQLDVGLGFAGLLLQLVDGLARRWRGGPRGRGHARRRRAIGSPKPRR
jgi:hypothetical protein